METVAKLCICGETRGCDATYVLYQEVRIGRWLVALWCHEYLGLLYDLAVVNYSLLINNRDLQFNVLLGRVQSQTPSAVAHPKTDCVVRRC